MKWSEQLKAILPELRNGLRATLFLLKITTYVTVGLVAWRTLDGHVSELAKYFITIVAAYLGGFVVDGILTYLLPYASSKLGANVDKREKRFHKVTKVFAILLLLATGTLSWWAMPEVANIAIKEQDANPFLSTILSLDSVSLNLEAEKSKRLRWAKSTESKRVEAAQSKGHALVIDAINKAPSERWKRLMRQNNAWFKSPRRDRRIRSYVAAVQKAKQDSAEIVARELNVTSAMLASGGTSGVRDTAVASIAGALSTGVKQRESRITNVSRVLFTMDVLWMVLAFLLAWGIGYVDGHVIKPKQTFAGMLFEVSETYSTFLVSKTKTALLSLIGDVDTSVGIVPDSSIAAEPSKPPQTVKTKESEGVLPHEHSEPETEYREVIVDLSKAKKDARNSWKAANTAKTETTRERNRERYNRLKAQLSELGVRIDEVSKTSISFPES